MKLVSAPVVSSEELSPGVRLLRARAPEIAALARPGQYVMVRCGEGQEMPLRRPLSVHRAYEDGTLAFLLRVVGRGTEWLTARGRGDALDLFGPLGKGFEILPKSRKVLLAAGGIGIAPLVALGDRAAAGGLAVTLIIGCGTASQVYPPRLLPRGIKHVIVTEDCSLGVKGLVTDILPEYSSDADQIFACGPLPMYRRMAEMADVFRGRSVQVLLEAVLGCGVGACLGCTIDTVHGQRSVCKDGPVFELGDVVWEKMTAPPGGRRC